MTEKQYNAMSRAAYAVRKLKDGKLAALTPQDCELIKQLLKDKDGYSEQAVAHNRTTLLARQDIERCKQVVALASTAATCQHGNALCPGCAAELAQLKATCDAVF